MYMEATFLFVCLEFFECFFFEFFQATRAYFIYFFQDEKNPPSLTLFNAFYILKILNHVGI